jgi:hypothetical protein
MHYLIKIKIANIYLKFACVYIYIYIYIKNLNIIQIYLYNINIYLKLCSNEFWMEFYNIYTYKVK